MSNITINKKTIYLLRGVSGCGKTTLAKTLEASLPDAVAIAADDYFYDDNGTYCFELDKLHLAHKECKGLVHIRMFFNKENIIVHNTFTTEKELKPYLAMASEYGYNVVSLIVERRHDGKSLHCTDDIIEKQAKRFSVKI